MMKPVLFSKVSKYNEGCEKDAVMIEICQDVKISAHQKYPILFDVLASPVDCFQAS